MEIIEKRLSDALYEAAMKAKSELKYNPSLFLQMFGSDGGLLTAKKLLASKTISDGFTKLFLLGRLDLTVEAIVLKDDWISLFTTQEIATAEKRLKDANFRYIKYQVTIEEDEKRAPWSREELKASLVAYVQMLNFEQQGVRYNKSEINENLRSKELQKRTKSSVELRMQNLSAVMENLCLPRVEGYLPARNIGANVTKVILDILDEIGFVDRDLYDSTVDNHELDERANKLIALIGSGVPQGNKSPKRQTSSFTVYYQRDPLVKAWVLKNSAGNCEQCHNNAPFLKEDNTFFLEVHHIVPLAEDGEDTINNTVALCPNCHRELHFSRDRIERTRELVTKIERPTRHSPM